MSAPPSVPPFATSVQPSVRVGRQGLAGQSSIRVFAVEVRDMLDRFAWTMIVLFVANLAIVALLWRNRTRHVASP